MAKNSGHKIRLKDGSFYVDVTISLTLLAPDESVFAGDYPVAGLVAQHILNEIPKKHLDDIDRITANEMVQEFLYTYAVLDVEENVKETRNEADKEAKEKEEEDRIAKMEEEYENANVSPDDLPEHIQYTETDIETLEQEAREYAFSRQAGVTEGADKPERSLYFQPPNIS